MTSNNQQFYSVLPRNNRAFRNLYYAHAISTLGDWFTSIALMIVVYNVTQSGLMVSFTLITKALPSLLISPFPGVIIDRANRKKIMIASNLRNAILIPFLILAQDHIWIVFIVNTLTSISSVFYSPARQSVIPQVVEGSKLTIANTLSSTTWGVMSVLGASLGGIVSEYFSVSAIFIMDSATFVVALFFIWFTDIPAAGANKRKLTFFQDMKQGFVFVWKSPIILALIAAGSSWGVVGGAYQVLLTFFGMDVFGGGKNGVGLLYAVQGIGVILGGWVVKNPQARWNYQAQHEVRAQIARLYPEEHFVQATVIFHAKEHELNQVVPDYSQIRAAYPDEVKLHVYAIVFASVTEQNKREHAEKITALLTFLQKAGNKKFSVEVDYFDPMMEMREKETLATMGTHEFTLTYKDQHEYRVEIPLERAAITQTPQQVETYF
ncbi:MFS transporter [Brevibacillus sp. GCM10020057]|uniref:MFS transporter n=1 Tax=Brevibacillus sp. GCM10020057 TaxID=3317327 RepID=UPI0036445EFD